MNYFNELTKAMTWLGEQKNTYFIGQAVSYAGTGMSNTLKNVSEDKRLELPVCEELQMGMTTGLALAGFCPISIYPRWNFLLCAISGLVNHLDKYEILSDGGYKPHAIIRTGIGSVVPLDPQYQHKGDFTGVIQAMCIHTNVIRLEQPRDIFPAYEEAYYSGGVHILCEVSDFLNSDFYDTYNKFRETYMGY